MWYIGSCFSHYQTFKEILPSTGKERMSNTVKMKHHTITIPTITPVDCILEAACNLDATLHQLPKNASFQRNWGNWALTSSITWKKKQPLPVNSLQLHKMKQKEIETNNKIPQSSSPQMIPKSQPATNINYISDNKEDKETDRLPKPKQVVP